MKVQDAFRGFLVLASFSERERWGDGTVRRVRILADVIGNSIVRRQHRIELDELIAFEGTVSETAASLLAAPADAVNDLIEQALGALGKVLGADLCTFMQIDPDTRDLVHTHQWLSGEIDSDLSFLNVAVSERAPVVWRELRKLRTVRISSVRDFPSDALEEREICREMGLKSVLFVPFESGGTLLGALVLNTMKREREWSDGLVRRVSLAAEILGQAIARSRAEIGQRKALEEVKCLQERLQQENVYLRDQAELEFKHEEIVGRSRSLKEILRQVEQVAPTDSTVLVLGETGTGKELVARQIHTLSRRASRPLVKVNCAALPSALVESELFGREKGAYTGALSRQTGRFELADGSTIFLDEIGELPLDLQAKLLRVLQDGELERLGSTRTIKVDARVIAATNRDLNEAVSKGTFREDLFYRLNVFPITVPPLRERRDDILPLVWFFLNQFGRSMGRPIETIPRKTADQLLAYPWPGNVRELRNVLERAMIRCRGEESLRVEFSGPGEAVSLEGQTLDEVQRRHISRVLEQTGWKVRGNNGAAALLGMKPTTLEGRMAKLGIRRPDPSSRIS
jgi:transcriptional regulator with GAF, ATPase, and Fis domain